MIHPPEGDTALSQQIESIPESSVVLPSVTRASSNGLRDASNEERGASVLLLLASIELSAGSVLFLLLLVSSSPAPRSLEVEEPTLSYSSSWA